MITKSACQVQTPTLEQASLMMAIRQFRRTIDMVKTKRSSRRTPMMGLWLL